jgi:hypothetical protein
MPIIEIRIPEEKPIQGYNFSGITYLKAKRHITPSNITLIVWVNVTMIPSNMACFTVPLLPMR